jgi:circadian clock protein KaiB
MTTEQPAVRYFLKLFVAGQTAKADFAVANIQSIFKRLDLQYDLVIIDILEQPHLAEEYRILATPTLFRLSPLPVRRLVGDLSDEERVCQGLGFPRTPVKVGIKE